MYLSSKVLGWLVAQHTWTVMHIWDPCDAPNRFWHRSARTHTCAASQCLSFSLGLFRSLYICCCFQRLPFFLLHFVFLSAYVFSLLLFITKCVTMSTQYIRYICSFGYDSISFCHREWSRHILTSIGAREKPVAEIERKTWINRPFLLIIHRLAISLFSVPSCKGRALRMVVFVFFALVLD